MEHHRAFFTPISTKKRRFIYDMYRSYAKTANKRTSDQMARNFCYALSHGASSATSFISTQTLSLSMYGAFFGLFWCYFKIFSLTFIFSLMSDAISNIFSLSISTRSTYHVQLPFFPNGTP